MSDYYLNPANIREKFTIKVDWDIDLESVEGCHGTDLLFTDDPVEIPLTLYKNGEVFVEWGDPDATDGTDASNPPINKAYVLNPSGELFERAPHIFVPFAEGFTRRCSLHLRKGTEIPKAAKSVGGCSDLVTVCKNIQLFLANNEFYSCYLESTDLNRQLTAHQKAIVERFFAAVRNTFPQEFATK